MNPLLIFGVCAFSMFFLCYNLLMFAKERVDYGTEPDTRPIDGVIVIGH